MQRNPSPSSTPPRPRWQRDRWDQPDTIYFWSGRGGQFAQFSNFAHTPFAMRSWRDPSQLVLYPSGEHAFQAAKAGSLSEHEQIRQAPTPLAAKRLGRNASLPENWDIRRRIVMLTLLRAKFARPDLSELLLCTGERLLAEDSPYDAVWGCRDKAGGYTGQNLLGRALMRVRDELRGNTGQERSR